jgi:hypothetical protein
MRLLTWGRPALQPESMARADVVAELVASSIERDGYANWRARGHSMLGAIRDGDVVRLVAPTPLSLRRGAVAMAALADGRLVLHRVRKVDQASVTLRGDSCRRGDGSVPVESIVAVASPTPRRTPRSLLYRLLFWS